MGLIGCLRRRIEVSLVSGASHGVDKSRAVQKRTHTRTHTHTILYVASRRARARCALGHSCARAAQLCALHVCTDCAWTRFGFLLHMSAKLRKVCARDWCVCARVCAQKTVNTLPLLRREHCPNERRKFGLALARVLCASLRRAKSRRAMSERASERRAFHCGGGGDGSELEPMATVVAVPTSKCTGVSA